MDADKRHPDSVVLLVGSNTLPGYLAWVALDCPQRVALIATDKTKNQRDALKDVLEAGGATVDVERVDEFDAKGVRELAAKLSKGGYAHLDYTGGTKVMAANARRAWTGDDRSVSYVSDARRLLVLSDEATEPLDLRPVRPTGTVLDLLCKLHGLDVSQGPRRTGDPGPPTADDSAALVDRDRNGVGLGAIPFT